METGNVIVEINSFDTLYFGVLKDKGVKLGYWDPDFGCTNYGGDIFLKYGEVYTLHHMEGDIYSFKQNGNLLYSPLHTFLRMDDWVIFPIRSVVEEVLAKENITRKLEPLPYFPYELPAPTIGYIRQILRCGQNSALKDEDGNDVVISFQGSSVEVKATVLGTLEVVYQGSLDDILPLLDI